MDKTQARKTCSVPLCNNTHKTAPNKHFFSSPYSEDRRKEWMNAMKREHPLSGKTVFFVCEDHFNMKCDLRNQMQSNLMPGTRPHLKTTAVPSKFVCQRRISKERNNVKEKIKNRILVDQLLKGADSGPPVAALDEKRARSLPSITMQEDSCPHSPGPHSTLNSAAACDQGADSGPPVAALDEKRARSLPSITMQEDSCQHSPGPHSTLNSAAACDQGADSGPPVAALDEKRARSLPSITMQEDSCQHSPGPHSTLNSAAACDQGADSGPPVAALDEKRARSLPSITMQEDSCPHSPGPHSTLNSAAACDQVVSRGRKKQERHFRSKAVQVGVCSKDANVSPIKNVFVDTGISPMKRVLMINDVYASDSSIPSSLYGDTHDSDNTYLPETSFESSNENEELEIKVHALAHTRFLSKKESMHYLGMPPNCQFLMSILIEQIDHSSGDNINISSEDIVTLILRKIRRAYTFQCLGDSYGISESYAARLFSTHMPVLAATLKSFVRTLPVETVERNLPLSFWARFRNVYIIIDCFEIEIKTPGNSYDQSDSYSDYKKCNSAKYLIGISPDGAIMFISEGYVGRNSDQEITVDSKFIDIIPSKKDVMCDRGFKNLESMLSVKSCKLVRPPSVKKDEQLSKQLCKLGQKIASLRSHVERSIGRIREFRFLDIHSAVPGTLLPDLDKAVVIACALVNCQSDLIKV